MPNPCYLVKVEADTNNNKFYEMTPVKDSYTFIGRHGRIGYAGKTKTYDMSLWDSKYKEKIRKGYVDKTSMHIVNKKDKKTSLGIDDVSIKTIVERLMSYAKQMVERNYTISSDVVTQMMIDDAQDILNGLADRLSLQQFNRSLQDLFRTIPRKMNKVSEFLANDNADMQAILEREQDLLDVMKGQVINDVSTNDNSSGSILDVLGLTFSDITSTDKKEIVKNLSDISGRYSNAWQVTNAKTQERFNKFIKQEKIKERLSLWHGSRNENWWNIINSGLLINPPAKTTGKMFGYGIYFAPRAKKSLGYTSINGSYWAGGYDSTAFMAIFDVAYGKPYDVHQSTDMNYERLKNMGLHSLHAHAGRSLYNDEIVVYSESQVTIKYLVEIK